MRALCYREKIKTDFGTFYLNLDVTTDGRATRVYIAQPQKLDDTQVGRLLESVEQTLNGLIKEARA